MPASRNIIEKTGEPLKNFDEIQQMAVQTLRMEAEAIENLCERIDVRFVRCIELIYGSKGRVVVTGIGKSANIASKLVATFNSTGTPALFMHAADAIHGDLGCVQPGDVVICISKSGNTPEIKVLIPLIREMGNPLIAITGNLSGQLATNATVVLDTTVEREACPNNLAPTTSTTAQLAMGDALAVCLLDYRNFSSDDFARFHPGGALGKRLYLRVSDLSKANPMPIVAPNTEIKSVIVEISSKRLGATAVVENGELLGVITDGDLRRLMERTDSFTTYKAKDIMSVNPKSIDESALAVEAVEVIRKHVISQLVVTKNGSFAGFLHLHDLLREGLI